MASSSLIRWYSRSWPPFLSVLGCSVLFVSVRQLIPEDLAEILPGPEPARVLAGLELSRLSGFDCVEVLKAQYRQANHELGENAGTTGADFLAQERILSPSVWPRC